MDDSKDSLRFTAPPKIEREWMEKTVAAIEAAGKPKILIDLSPIRSMSSGQLAYLLQIQRVIGVPLRVSGVAERVRNMLVLLECDRYFQILD